MKQQHFIYYKTSNQDGTAFRVIQANVRTGKAYATRFGIYGPSETLSAGFWQTDSTYASGNQTRRVTRKHFRHYVKTGEWLP